MKSPSFATLAAQALAFSALTSAAATANADVSIFDNGKAVTVDCARDKSVNLVGNDLNVTLVGTCALVTVGGNGVTVRGSAARFYVGGNKNKVAAEGADEIYVAGNRNVVSWRRGLTRNEPAIANPGSDNAISRAQ